MSSSKKLGIAYVSAVALALGLGVAWRVSLAQQKDAPAGAAANAPSKAGKQRAEQAPGTTQAHPLNGSVWQIGASRRYSVDFSSRLEASESMPDAWFSLVGSATLEFTRVEAPTEPSPGEYYLRGELSSLSLVLENEELSGQHIESRIEKNLDKPFVVRVSEDGRIQSLGTLKEVRGMGYNILRSAVAALQFVEPSGNSPTWATWDTQESDQNGVYTARYKRLPTGAFEKTKPIYSYAVSANLAGTTSGRYPTIQSRTELSWTQGRVIKAEMDEAMIQPLGDDQVFKTKMNITLELTKESGGGPRRVDTQGMEFLSLFENKANTLNAAAELKQKRDLVAGATFDDLRKQISELSSTDQNREARWQLAERLMALLQLDPSVVGDTLREIRSTDDVEERDVLLAALGGVDAPETRGALAELARDQKLDTDLRERAVMHLGVTDEGHAERIHSLQDVASDTSNAVVHERATLALGAAAYAGANTDGAEDATEQAVQTLSDGYKRATTPKEQRLYLDALGNAGSERGLDAVRSALGSSDPNVRAAAADSLRRVPGAEADALLVSSLRGDPHPRVRVSAIQALVERELTEAVLAALADGLRVEQDSDVRLEIILLLGRRVKTVAAAAQLLAWSATHDPQEDLREAASKAIKAP
jgi:HEAT repeat protein